MEIAQAITVLLTMGTEDPSRERFDAIHLSINALKLCASNKLDPQAEVGKDFRVLLDKIFEKSND